jgi:hypothetical protein
VSLHDALLPHKRVVDFHPKKERRDKWTLGESYILIFVSIHVSHEFKDTIHIQGRLEVFGGYVQNIKVALFNNKKKTSFFYKKKPSSI